VSVSDWLLKISISKYQGYWQLPFWKSTMMMQNGSFRNIGHPPSWIFQKNENFMPWGALSDTTIRCLFVCPCLCYRHAGCMAQLPRLSACWLPAVVWPPEMCRLQTHPRTDIDLPRVELPSSEGGISSRRPQGDNLFNGQCTWDTDLRVLGLLWSAVPTR